MSYTKANTAGNSQQKSRAAANQGTAAGKALPAVTLLSLHQTENTIQRQVFKMVGIRNRKEVDYTEIKDLATDIYNEIVRFKAIEDCYKTVDALGGDFNEGAIAEEIRQKGYMTAGRYNYKDLAKIIYRDMEQKIIKDQTSNTEPVTDGVKVKKVICSAKVGGPNKVHLQTKDSIDLHAPTITVNAIVGIESGEKVKPGQWTVGLTQTAFSVKRSFEFLSDDGNTSRRVKSTTLLGSPANDRNEDAKAPWYSKASSSGVDEGFGVHNVHLLDKPGEEFTLKGNSISLKKCQGTDLFKTWLILHNSETRETVFLHEWTWKVMYDMGEGVVTILDDPAGKELKASVGDAVLDGPRCRDVLKSEPEYNVRNIFPFVSAVNDLNKAIKYLRKQQLEIGEVIDCHNKMQSAYMALPPDDQKELKTERDHAANIFWQCLEKDKTF